MLLFFSHPSEMLPIFYHFPHVLRGIIGFIIMKKLPNSHDMAANMSIPIEEKMHIDKIMHYVLIGAQDALSNYTSMTRKWLIFYFISTLLC